MLESVKNVTKNFVERYFQNCHSAWLVGSYTTGNYNSESDIDIIIISKVLNQQFIENFDFEGYCVQALVFPFGNLNEIIKKDYEEKNGVYINMLKTAILIKGNQSFFGSIKTIISHMAKHGPTPYHYQFMRRLRFQTTSKLDDLRASNDFNESIFILFELFQNLSKLNLAAHKHWIGYHGKHLARVLQEFDPNLYTNITKAIQQFVGSENPEPVIKVVEDNLKKFGGELHFFSTKELFTEVKSAQLVIQLRYNEVLNTSVLFNEILPPITDIISKSSDQVYWYIFKKDEDINVKEAVYIVVNEAKIKINEYTIPAIEQFISNNEHLLFRGKIRIVYPSEYNTSLTFGFKNTITYGETLFSKLSKSFILSSEGEKFDENKNILLAIRLLMELGIGTKFNKKDFCTFLEEIVTILLPKSIDISDSFNVQQLTDQVEKVKTVFNDTYMKQHDMLSQLFVPYIINWQSNKEGIEQFDDFVQYIGTIVKEVQKDQFSDNFHMPRYIQIEGKSDNKSAEINYYFALINRLLECLFISDEKKAFTIYVTMRLLREELSVKKINK